MFRNRPYILMSKLLPTLISQETKEDQNQKSAIAEAEETQRLQVVQAPFPEDLTNEDGVDDAQETLRLHPSQE